MRVLFGVTGSVASILTPKLVKELEANGHKVQVIATKASFYFWDPNQVDVPIWMEEDEWPEGGYSKNMRIAHIELREWADILLIAPLTANTLAKMATGQCDNLLTCVVRAWDLKKQMVVAPAMNTKMWESPFTNEHLKTIKAVYGAAIIDPVPKRLACGEDGIGAMEDIKVIVASIDSLSEEEGKRC